MKAISPAAWRWFNNPASDPEASADILSHCRREMRGMRRGEPGKRLNMAAHGSRERSSEVGEIVAERKWGGCAAIEN